MHKEPLEGFGLGAQAGYGLHFKRILSGCPVEIRLQGTRRAWGHKGVMETFRCDYHGSGGGEQCLGPGYTLKAEAVAFPGRVDVR